MDDIRGSLSKMKKKVKHRLTGKKGKPGVTGANPAGEGADSTSSLPQPESHVVAGKSYDGEADQADTAGEQILSTDGPESVPTCGGDDGQTEGEVDVDGGEASQSHPHPHSDSEIGSGSGSSREVEWFSLSGSTPPLSPHGEEPGGT